MFISATAPFNGGLFNFAKPPSHAAGAILGDLDNDGDVDIFDYSTLVGNFGKTGVGILGDLDANNKVDIFDYSILVGNFGKTGTVTACTTIIIPAYFAPNPQTVWNQGIAGAPTVSIMIANPNSGPGTTTDANYTAIISKAKTAGVKVYGYVDTNFANKTQATIQTDVNRWKSLYGVSDIFFDQVTADAGHVSFYSTLSNYVIAQSPSGLVIWNPGTVMDQGYMAIPGIWTVFENTFTSYQSATFPSWMSTYPANRFYHLVYGVSSAANMTTMLAKAKQNNAGYVYATSDVLPNPWDTLPSYFSTEISQLQQSCTSTASPTPVPSASATLKPSATPTPTPTPVPTPTPPAGSWWKPTAASPIHWQWQLTTLNTSTDILPNVTVYDIDGFENSAATVTNLHSRGAKVICYLSFGTFEDWRPDQASFPASVKGSGNGWPGEKWLDIRNITALAPIMDARLDMCKSKGFDAIEPDNIDGYSNSTGFPLTAQNQITYNQWIATEAHNRGLSVGLKNDIDQIPQLVSSFDWVLDEECNQFSECNTLTPFVSANKAVFETEYGSGTGQCSSLNSMHMNSMTRDLDLTAPNGSNRKPCIADTVNTWP